MHRALPTQRAYALPWSPHGAQTPTPPSRPGAEPGVPAGTHPAWPLPSGPCCRAHSAPHGCGTRTRALRSSGKRVKESGAPGSPLGPRSPEPLPFLGTADRIPRPPCYSGAATYSEDGQQKKRGREAHRPCDPATPRPRDPARCLPPHRATQAPRRPGSAFEDGGPRGGSSWVPEFPKPGGEPPALGTPSKGYVRAPTARVRASTFSWVCSLQRYVNRYATS